jgi:hypothetical protein
VLCGLAAFTATASLAHGAAPRPDANDRALAHRLNAQVASFRKVIAASGSSMQTSLDSCPVAKKSPSKAFALAFASIPALFTEIVTEYKPQLVALRDTVAGMHADSPLFRKWLTATRGSFDLILKFDNGGKPVDICKAGTVLLDKKSTPADIKRVLGIDPSLIITAFDDPSQKALTKLETPMTAFFVAAGLSKKNAKILTNSDS